MPRPSQRSPDAPTTPAVHTASRKRPRTVCNQCNDPGMTRVLLTDLQLFPLTDLQLFLVTDLQLFVEYVIVDVYSHVRKCS